MAPFWLLWLVGQCTVIAITYAFILTDDSMILAPVKQFIQAFIVHQTRTKPNLQASLLFMFKPVLGCETCLAGQLAAWSYPFMTTTYCWFDHVFVICSACLLAYLLGQKLLRDGKLR